MDDRTFAELESLFEGTNDQLIRSTGGSTAESTGGPSGSRRKSTYVRTPIRITRTLSSSSEYMSNRGRIDSDEYPDSCPSSPVSSPETIPSSESDFEEGSHRRLNKRIFDSDHDQISVSDNVSEGSYESPEDALEKERLMKIRLDELNDRGNKSIQNSKPVVLSANLFSNIRQSVPALQTMFKKTGEEEMRRAIKQYLDQETPSDTFIMSNVEVEELSYIFKTLVCIKYMEVAGCKLKNLKNLPPNLERLNARENELTQIYSAEIPDTVTELHLSKNKISFVDLSTSLNIEMLNISSNPLNDLLLFPPNIRSLNVSSSNIDSVEHFEKLRYLTYLKISSSDIDNVDDLPDGIEELHMTKLMMGKSGGKIDKLPHNLEKLIANNAGIRVINFHKFPPFLKYLDLSCNELFSLPEIVSENIHFLDVSNNNLMFVDNVPRDAGLLDYSKNPALRFTPDQQDTIDILKRRTNATIMTNGINCNTTDYDATNYGSGPTITESGRRFGLNGKYDPPCSMSMEDDYEWITRNSESFGYGTMQSSIIRGSYQEKESGSLEPLLFQNGKQTPEIPEAPEGPVPQEGHVPQEIPSSSSTSSSSSSSSSAMNQKPLVPQRMYGGRGRRGRRGGRVQFGPQKPKPEPIPLYVQKIKGSDTFIPTRNSSRKIAHRFVYDV